MTRTGDQVNTSSLWDFYILYRESQRLVVNTLLVYCKFLDLNFSKVQDFGATLSERWPCHIWPVGRM